MFKIYLKDQIANEISQILPEVKKIYEVESYQNLDGFIKIGSYSIPYDHILFIKEEP